jgi:hypothetical protein
MNYQRILIVELEKSEAFGKALYPTKTSIGARGLAPTTPRLIDKALPQGPAPEI